MTKTRFDNKRIWMEDIFSRNNPFVLIFFMAVIVLVIGLTFTFLSLFVWIASLVLAVFIVFFIIWFWLNKWW